MTTDFFTADRIAATIEWAKAEAEIIAARPDFDEAFFGKYLAGRRRAVDLLSSIQSGERLSRADEKMAAEYVLMAERGVTFA